MDDFRAKASDRGIFKKLKSSRELEQIDEVFAVSTEVLVRNDRFRSHPHRMRQYRRLIIEEELNQWRKYSGKF